MKLAIHVRKEHDDNHVTYIHHIFKAVLETGDAQQ